MKIKSVSTMGSTFAVGRCIPGDCYSPAIARIECTSSGTFQIFGENGSLLASLFNCPAIVTWEQKETPINLVR